MIVEWFLDLMAGISDWFMGLFGTDEPPAWLSGIGGFIGQLVERASGLGAWFPFVLFGAVAGTCLALWLTFWIVKGIRWVWGLTPFSGGS